MFHSARPPMTYGAAGHDRRSRRGQGGPEGFASMSVRASLIIALILLFLHACRKASQEIAGRDGGARDSSRSSCLLNVYPTQLSRAERSADAGGDQPGLPGRDTRRRTGGRFVGIRKLAFKSYPLLPCVVLKGYAGAGGRPEQHRRLAILCEVSRNNSVRRPSHVVQRRAAGAYGQGFWCMQPLLRFPTGLPPSE